MTRSDVRPRTGVRPLVLHQQSSLMAERGEQCEAEAMSSCHIVTGGPSVLIGRVIPMIHPQAVRCGTLAEVQPAVTPSLINPFTRICRSAVHMAVLLTYRVRILPKESVVAQFSCAVASHASRPLNPF